MTAPNQLNVPAEPQTPYEAGKDSVINEPNTVNCNFKWFSTPENTDEWERGVREAKATLLKGEKDE